jgi:hypothetical protein
MEGVDDEACPARYTVAQAVENLVTRRVPIVPA